MQRQLESQYFLKSHLLIEIVFLKYTYHKLRAIQHTNYQTLKQGDTKKLYSVADLERISIAHTPMQPDYTV